jgi:hypothetical protein
MFISSLTFKSEEDGKLKLEAVIAFWFRMSVFYAVKDAEDMSTSDLEGTSAPSSVKRSWQNMDSSGADPIILAQKLFN